MKNISKKAAQYRKTKRYDESGLKNTFLEVKDENKKRTPFDEIKEFSKKSRSAEKNPKGDLTRNSFVVRFCTTQDLQTSKGTS